MRREEGSKDGELRSRADEFACKEAGQPAFREKARRKKRTEVLGLLQHPIDRHKSPVLREKRLSRCLHSSGTLPVDTNPRLVLPLLPDNSNLLPLTVQQALGTVLRLLLG